MKAKDVMLPFAILFIANFTVLLAWTLVAPLRWTRVVVPNYDEFGRSIESYGTCFASNESSSARNAFLVVLGVFNFVAVVLANYQCFLSRTVPSDFNESYHITLSMLSILEGFLLGIPLLFLCARKPTAQYVVSSILIFLLCMAILVPTFGSKIFVKQKHAKLRTSEWGRAWRNYDETSPRRRSAIGSSRTGASSSRDFTRRSSQAGSLVHQSSVAAIRARVAEKARQESPVVPSSRSCTKNQAI